LFGKPPATPQFQPSKIAKYLPNREKPPPVGVKGVKPRTCEEDYHRQDLELIDDFNNQKCGSEKLKV
jgi:hypothetical protein